MRKEELAKELNGIQYRSDIPKELLQKAKENGLLIITGASDDLIEFEGAFEDEGDCYGGGAFLINKEGILHKPDQDDFGDDEDSENEFYEKLKEYHRARKSGRGIIAEWGKDDEYSWIYVTSIPHVTFDVMEDTDKYCKGIVLDINDIK